VIRGDDDQDSKIGYSCSLWKAGNGLTDPCRKNWLNQNWLNKTVQGIIGKTKLNVNPNPLHVNCCEGQSKEHFLLKRVSQISSYILCIVL
jgi:hypothetical protein